jgi:hypothetical protein
MRPLRSQLDRLELFGVLLLAFGSLVDDVEIVVFAANLDHGVGGAAEHVRAALARSSWTPEWCTIITLAPVASRSLSAGGDIGVHVGLLVLVAGAEGSGQGVDHDQRRLGFELKDGRHHRVQVVAGTRYAVGYQLEQGRREIAPAGSGASLWRVCRGRASLRRRHRRPAPAWWPCRATGARWQRTWPCRAPRRTSSILSGPRASTGRFGKHVLDQE